MLSEIRQLAPLEHFCCPAAHFDGIPEGLSKMRTTLVCFFSDNCIAVFGYGPLEGRTVSDTMPQAP